MHTNIAPRSPDLADQVRSFIGTVAPHEPVTDIEPAAAFSVEDEVYAVCRANIARESVYVMGLACPAGIYRDTHLPPHVVFRRHIGQLIRLESDNAHHA